MSDSNLFPLSADASVLRAEIRHLKHVSNLLINHVQQLISCGDSDYLQLINERITTCAQDANSAYCTLYRLGFEHGVKFGAAAAERMPRLSVTVDGRVCTVGYCRGIADSLQMAIDVRELELQKLAPPE